MGVFDDMIAGDADQVFADTDGAAETAVYIHEQEGVEEEVTGIANRFEPESLAAATGAPGTAGSRVRTIKMTFLMPMSYVAAPDTGKDKLRIALKRGQEPRDLQIVEAHDAGGSWLLELK